MLRKGHLLGIAPGGGYEAQLGNPDYRVMWKQRSGFAAVAFEANVPIIPVFTENIREAFVNMQTGMDLWKVIYRYIIIGYPIMTSHLHFSTILCSIDTER